MQPSISIVANEDFFNRKDFRDAFTQEWAARIALSSISEFDPVFSQTNIVVVAVAISEGNQRIGGVDGKYASLLRKLKGFYLIVYSKDENVEYDRFAAEAQQVELEKVKSTFLWKECVAKQNTFEFLVSKLNEFEAKRAIGKRKKSLESLLKLAIIGQVIALALVLLIDSGSCQYHLPDCSATEVLLSSLNQQSEKLNSKQKQITNSLVEIDVIHTRCTSTICNPAPDKEMFSENFSRYCSTSLIRQKVQDDATKVEPCSEGRAHKQFLVNTTITMQASVFLNALEEEKKQATLESERVKIESNRIREEIEKETENLKNCKSSVLKCWKLWNWELPK